MDFTNQLIIRLLSSKIHAVLANFRLNTLLRVRGQGGNMCCNNNASRNGEAWSEYNCNVSVVSNNSTGCGCGEVFTTTGCGCGGNRNGCGCGGNRNGCGCGGNIFGLGCGCGGNIFGLGCGCGGNIFGLGCGCGCGGNRNGCGCGGNRNGCGCGGNRNGCGCGGNRTGCGCGGNRTGCGCGGNRTGCGCGGNRTGCGCPEVYTSTTSLNETRNCNCVYVNPYTNVAFNGCVSMYGRCGSAI